jgi:hypothetical protein
MQEVAAKKTKRKYGSIKKVFASVEDAEEEKKKNVFSVEERLKKINEIKTLKINTPWTSGSSDESSNDFLYYKIQQAKMRKGPNPTFNNIIEFLDRENINQLDFNGLLKDALMNKDQTAIAKKANALSEYRKPAAKTSLFMRRKLMKQE